MGLITNYNLKVLTNDIDHVLLKLTLCPNVEIRNVFRRTGIIQIKANTLDNVSDISEVLTVEKDNKFYINRIAII
jgi:hypothetical protein